MCCSLRFFGCPLVLIKNTGWFGHKSPADSLCRAASANNKQVVSVCITMPLRQQSGFWHYTLIARSNYCVINLPNIGGQLVFEQFLHLETLKFSQRVWKLHLHNYIFEQSWEGRVETVTGWYELYCMRHPPCKGSNISPLFVFIACPLDGGCVVHFVISALSTELSAFTHQDVKGNGKKKQWAQEKVISYLQCLQVNTGWRTALR